MAVRSSVGTVCLVLNSKADEGDIRVIFAESDQGTTRDTDKPVYRVVIGGYLNSKSYISRFNPGPSACVRACSRACVHASLRSVILCPSACVRAFIR